MNRFSFVSLALVLCVVSCATATDFPELRLPNCKNVTLVGMWQTVDFDNGDLLSSARVAIFKSIPYAKPPVGSLRFHSPVDMFCPTIDNKFDASTFGPVCPQIGLVSPSFSGKEDCLTLTLHIPEWILADVNRKTTSWPILTYLYGGDLTNGSEEQPMSFFAANTPPPSAGAKPGSEDKGVIVVVPNYRLGLAGFLAVPSMAEPTSAVVGNWGMQDQVSALRWVRVNLASQFGGLNGTSVTIMGQSSGGTSVLTLTHSNPNIVGGLFRSAISLSASPNITMNRAKKFEQDGLTVQALNCSNASNPSAELQCLRDIPIEVLVKHMPIPWDTMTSGIWNMSKLNNNSINGLNLAGLVFVDGELLQMPLLEALSSGVNNNVSLMIGTMGQEPNLMPAPAPKVRELNKTQWKQYLQEQIFASWGEHVANSTATLMTSLYSDAVQIDPQLAYDSMNADYAVGCASSILANSRASSSPSAAPVYIYKNEWPPQFSLLGSEHNGGQLSYAFHMWDLVSAVHQWWWALPYVPSAEDLELSSLLRVHWGSIIWNGDLHPDTNWPSFQQSNATFVYSRRDRYPFLQNGSQPIVFYNRDKCAAYSNLGINQNYWWCD